MTRTFCDLCDKAVEDDKRLIVKYAMRSYETIFDVCDKCYNDMLDYMHNKKTKEEK